MEIIEVGIDSATINVDRISCRKRSRTKPVNNTPRYTLLIVSSMLLFTKTDSSFTILRLHPFGRDAWISGITLLIASATLTTFPSELLIIPILTIFSSLVLV